MTKSYRIGIDARLYEETGVGRYIRSLITHLAIIDAKNEYVLFLRKNTFGSIKLPGKNFSKVLADVRWHTPQEQIIMPFLLLREKLDLVHFPYQNFAPSFFYPKPFILTVHDIIIAQTKTGRLALLPDIFTSTKQFFFRRLLTSSLKRACTILAVSQVTKRDIAKYFAIDTNKIEVTYEASDLSGNDERFSKTYDYFLYVGAAHPHKNLPFLIDAFKKADLGSVKLILAGKDNFFYPRIASLVRERGLSDKISIERDVTDERLSTLYLQTLGVVLPTKAEGFGLPAVEAMSLGALVIASDIPIMREICLDAALYFKQKDKKSLVAILQQVAAHSSIFDDKRALGFKRAQAFSWQRTAQQTLKSYEHCLGLRSSQ